MKILKQILAILILIILFPLFVVIGVMVGLFLVTDFMTEFYHNLIGENKNAKD